MYVHGACEKIGDMQAVHAGTCAEYGYGHANGTGSMEDPDSDFKGNMIKYTKYVKKSALLIVLVWEIYLVTALF